MGYETNLIIIYYIIMYVILHVHYIIYNNPIWITGTKLDKGKVSSSYFEILINGRERSRGLFTQQLGVFYEPNTAQGTVGTKMKKTPSLPSENSQARKTERQEANDHVWKDV